MSESLAKIRSVICGALVLCWLSVAGGCPAAYAEQAPDSDPAADEELVLDDVVVTATRYATTRLDTPVPVDVIESSDLDERQPANVAEAAGVAPGVGVNSPAGGYYSNPNIRGLGGRRVILLLDGRRIDSGKPIGVSGYFLSMGNVRRLEVMRGPGSVLYGSDAIGGVIQILSPDPLALPGFTMQGRLQHATSASEVMTDAGLGWATERFGLRLYGQFRHAENYHTGGGATMPNSDYRDGMISLAVAGLLGAQHRLDLRGWFYLGGPIGRGMNDLDLEKRRVIRFPHDRVSIVSADYRFSPDHPIVENFQLQVGFDYTDRLLAREMFSTDYERVTARMTQQSDFWTLTVAPVLQLSPYAKNTLLLGLDGLYRHMSMEQTTLTILPGGITPPPTVSYPYDGAQRGSVGAFVQDEQLVFADKLRISAGLRWDSIFQNYPTVDGGSETAVDGALSGNVGLVYSPLDAMSLTVNVGRAFRAPTMEEKFVKLVFCKGVVCGVADVKPETSWNVDLGFKGRWSVLEYGLFGYAIYFDDYISLTGSGQSGCDYDYTNIERALLSGAEGRVKLTFRKVAPHLNISLSADAAYVWGQDLARDEPLPQIPPFNAGATLRLYGRFNAQRMGYYVEAGGNYYHDQGRVSPLGNVSSQEELPTDAYGLLHAGAGVRLGPSDPSALSLRIGLRITNLLDVHYRDHLAAITGMGRNVMVNVQLLYR